MASRDAGQNSLRRRHRLLGDIPKVTPSSAIVGDLAQFMVANKLREEDVDTEQWVGKLPDSVVDYLAGGLGTPPGGFPEPPAHVLKARASRLKETRPVHGALRLRASGEGPVRKFGGRRLPHRRRTLVRPCILRFADYMEHRLVYDTSALTYSCFLASDGLNDEVEFGTSRRAEYVELRSISELDDNHVLEEGGIFRERWRGSSGSRTRRP